MTVVMEPTSVRLSEECGVEASGLGFIAFTVPTIHGFIARIGSDVSFGTAKYSVLLPSFRTASSNVADTVLLSHKRLKAR